ncbi:glycoside hydrolase family 15 protein [Acidianus manzaensis]|uniref:Glucoamylase n=1 Tax=Acidianus manzaensis TaxID=282676 RepID=A0A1W6K2E9_9CREN|nr:glycoside hydrolase family 15 protein [Acidianus manzaensis]ARM76675.1 glucoamylase [Acidianus manzaensis]
MIYGFVSNGKIAALYDENFYIRSLYYPYLGQYNHSVAGYFKIGVWHDGKFTWLDNIKDKRITMDNLTVNTEIKWDNLKIYLSDVAVFSHSVIMRRVNVEGPGFVRFIFYHDFKLNGYEIGDTAFYNPELDAVLHYKDNTWFLIGSSHNIYEYTTGRRDKNEVLSDCEDGKLNKNPIAQGSVASAISIAYPSFYYFIIAGESFDHVTKIFNEIKENPKFHYEKNKFYWDSITSSLSDNLAKISLAIMLGHVGDNGAIPASLDTDILKFNLDTYAYIWPRDSALTANVLDNAGYFSFTRNFYDLVFHKLFLDKGYLFQKYNPDGTFGSTWHPWTVRSKNSLNIQEDETATVIWAFWNYFLKSRDYAMLKDVYHVIRNAANFMTDFRDEKLKLPLESYDLWEEKLGVHTYTVASVYAGLKAASNFANMVGDEENKKKWNDTAEEVKNSLREYMFDKERGVFYKYVNIDDGKITSVDKTIESSTLGIIIFDVFDINDPIVESNVKQVMDKLWVKNIGGLARYGNDYYQRVNGNYNGIPGNVWIITTMWLAQYFAKKGDINKTKELLAWANSHAISGLLPEQISPFDGSPLSVIPLLWSHSEYLKTYLMINRG